MATTVLTQAGEEWVVDKLVAAAEAKYIGWGTGAGTSAKGDTDIFTAANEARVTGTVSEGSSADIYKVVGTITSEGTQTITNAGLFSTAGSGTPATGGVLVMHGDFTGIALQANDQIQFTFELTVA